MPVNVTCRNKTSISEDLLKVVSKKSEKLKKFFRKAENIEIIFSEEKYRRSCEIIVHADPMFVSASVEEADHGTAFDRALKAVTAQIKTRKASMLDRKKRATKPARRVAELEAAD